MSLPFLKNIKSQSTQNRKSYHAIETNIKGVIIHGNHLKESIQKQNFTFDKQNIIRNTEFENIRPFCYRIEIEGIELDDIDTKIRVNGFQIFEKKDQGWEFNVLSFCTIPIYPEILELSYDELMKTIFSTHSFISVTIESKHAVFHEQSFQVSLYRLWKVHDNYPKISISSSRPISLSTTVNYGIYSLLTFDYPSQEEITEKLFIFLECNGKKSINVKSPSDVSFISNPICIYPTDKDQKEPVSMKVKLLFHHQHKVKVQKDYEFYIVELLGFEWFEIESLIRQIYKNQEKKDIQKLEEISFRAKMLKFYALAELVNEMIHDIQVEQGFEDLNCDKMIGLLQEYSKVDDEDSFKQKLNVMKKVLEG